MASAGRLHKEPLLFVLLALLAAFAASLSTTMYCLSLFSGLPALFEHTRLLSQVLGDPLAQLRADHSERARRADAGYRFRFRDDFARRNERLPVCWLLTPRATTEYVSYQR